MIPLIYANGFDQYTDTADLELDPSWDNTNLAPGDVTIVPGQWGGNALSFNVNGAGGSLKSLGLRIPLQPAYRLNPRWFYFGCRIFVPTDVFAGTGNNMPFFILGGTGQAGQSIAVGLTQSNQIILSQHRPAFNSSGAPFQTGSLLGTITLGEWFHMQVVTRVGGTSEVFINGNSIGTHATPGSNGSASDAVIDTITLGNAANGNQQGMNINSPVKFMIDDLMIGVDTTSASSVDRTTLLVGDRRVEWLSATADDTVTGLSKSDATTTDFFEAVNSSSDGTTLDFVTTSTADQASLFTTSDTLLEAPEEITAVFVDLVVAKDAGNTASTFARGIINGDDTSTTIGVGQNYTQRQFKFDLDPLTSAAWTRAGVEGATFGFEFEE